MIEAVKKIKKEPTLKIFDFILIKLKPFILMV